MPLCALHHSFLDRRGDHTADQRGDSISDIGPRSTSDQY
jgi:hypothetical protein